jgi:uncharacterized protein (DUF1330 family)
MHATEEISMNIQPTREQVDRLAGSTDPDPVIMLNLLRFKERADGIDADDDITGAEAYQRYGAGVQSFLAGVGGRILWAVTPQESVIGPDQGEWDLVVAVEYPSRNAFLKMATDPDYLKIHAHREAAVADSRLIACKSFAA